MIISSTMNAAFCKSFWHVKICQQNHTASNDWLWNSNADIFSLLLFLAEFEITVPRGPVTGFYGEALILPCTFPVDSWDLSSTVITWQRGLDVVHSFYYSRDQLDRQNPHYVNRTSLFIQEMAGGNASLKLERVTLQDSGVYTCSISTNTGSQKKSFRVNIAGNKTWTDVHRKSCESISRSHSVIETVVCLF